MSESLEKLRQLITYSSISLTDQNDLLVFLPILPEESLAELYKLFKKKPKLLKEFDENFKARLKVLIDGLDSWDKLIEHEEKILEEAEKDENEEDKKNEENEENEEKIEK